MANVTIKKSTESTRVPANSYGDDIVYVGGNTFRNKVTGEIIEKYGYHTSPSGKEVFTNKNKEILVLKSKDIYEVGVIYANNKVLYRPSEIMTEAEIFDEAEKMGKPVEDFIFEATRKLGGTNKEK